MVEEKILARESVSRRRMSRKTCTDILDPTRTPSNRVCPSLNAELEYVVSTSTDLPHIRLTPVASAFDPRSSHTNTHPEEMDRRSSVSRRRETMGRRLSETAWKIACASAVERIRKTVIVGRCMR